MISMLSTLRFILSHPLNRARQTAAIRRFVAWQLASRLLSGVAVVPFANETRLIVAPGMTGATGNIYCGLQEFEEMAFTLHALRPGDLFLDVGANVGAFSILAASRGARVIGFEPVPETFACFLDNVRINRFESLIDARNQALGEKLGTLPFTTQFDTVNHVATAMDQGEVLEVPVVPLDSIALGCDKPILLKIDVEGFELPVLHGAMELLRRSNVLGIIIEVNGSGKRYGIDDAAIHETMRSIGFAPFQYSPFDRGLLPIRAGKAAPDNVIFVSQPDVLARRIETAPQFIVNGTSF